MLEDRIIVQDRGIDAGLAAFMKEMLPQDMKNAMDKVGQ